MTLARQDQAASSPLVDPGFTAWLYRPFVDLGPAEATGNPHLDGVTFACKSMTEEKEYPRLHGVLNPSVRKAIVREARLPQYDVADPLDLPKALRTPAWRELCARLAQFSQLDAADQLRVLWLLHRLCLHGAILAHAPRPSDAEVVGSESRAGIAFMRGLASFAFCNDGVATLDTTELERVATAGPRGGWARIEAAYLLSAAAAKLKHDPQRLRRWIDEQEQQISCAVVDDHTRAKLISRFHRVRAFVPQFAGDMAGMSAEMDAAETWADRMRRDTPETAAEWRTLTGAIYESRTKEALVLGNLNLAEQWARRSVQRAPSDPRAYLELGQVLVEQDRVEESLAAYRLAVRFGPPGTDIGWFMAGQCLEILGRLEEACDAYQAALALDPLAISAAERLSEISLRLPSADLSAWVQSRAASLRALKAERSRASDAVRPYQRYAGVLGR